MQLRSSKQFTPTTFLEMHDNAGAISPSAILKSPLLRDKPFAALALGFSETSIDNFRAGDAPVIENPELTGYGLISTLKFHVDLLGPAAQATSLHGRPIYIAPGKVNDILGNLFIRPKAAGVDKESSLRQLLPLCEMAQNQTQLHRNDSPLLELPTLSFSTSNRIFFVGNQYTQRIEIALNGTKASSDNSLPTCELICWFAHDAQPPLFISILRNPKSIATAAPDSENIRLPTLYRMKPIDIIQRDLEELKELLVRKAPSEQVAPHIPTLLSVIGVDYSYMSRLKESMLEKSATLMSPEEQSTLLTALVRKDRFCEGVLEQALDRPQVRETVELLTFAACNFLKGLEPTV